MCFDGQALVSPLVVTKFTLRCVQFSVRPKDKTSGVMVVTSGDTVQDNNGIGKFFGLSVIIHTDNFGPEAVFSVFGGSLIGVCEVNLSLFGGHAGGKG